MFLVRTVPLEMEIMRREHFNRWYQLGPYYMSVILFEIPFQVSALPSPETHAHANSSTRTHTRHQPNDPPPPQNAMHPEFPGIRTNLV